MSISQGSLKKNVYYANIFYLYIYIYLKKKKNAFFSPYFGFYIF